MFNGSYPSLADIAAVTGNRNSDGNGFADGNGWWVLIILFALFGGWGNAGWGGAGAGGNGRGGCGYTPCATQADVRAAVDQQTLISKIDQQTYGLADSFTALNNTLNNNFRGIDNAVCTLGYQGAQHASNLSSQLASCCCNIERAIDGNTTQGVMNTNALSRQMSDCCCDIEKMNMQNRFDAQTYNCNTLQAIDKLGDRIIDYMSNEKTQALRDENFALKLAASQAKQNQYLVDQIKPCPIPAYITCNPYAASYGCNACGCNG